MADIIKNYNIPCYTDYEMDAYSTYMEYVEQEVSKAKLPNHIKREMMEKRNLHKKNNGTIWFLEEQGYEVEFLPFRSWLLQRDREQKLKSLLGDK
jgi:hypothetical protein